MFSTAAAIHVTFKGTEEYVDGPAADMLGVLYWTGNKAHRAERERRLHVWNSRMRLNGSD